MAEPTSRSWRNIRAEAQKYLAEGALVLALCEEARQKLEQLSGRVGDRAFLLEEAMVMVRLLESFYRPGGRECPFFEPQVIALALAAVLYLLSPDDAIPDSVPWIGLRDDFEVLDYVSSELRDDLTRFRMWEIGLCDGSSPAP